MPRTSSCLRAAISVCCVMLMLVGCKSRATDVTRAGVRSDGADSSAALAGLIGDGGQSLYFPPGTYRFAGVSVPSRTTLTFAPGARILPGSTGNFLNVYGSHVRVSGGDFDGGGRLDAAVAGKNARYLRISGLRAANMRNAGVALVGGSKATVRRVATRDCEYGVVFSGVTDSEISDVSAHMSRRDGILVYSSSYRITVKDSTINGYATGLEHGRAGIHFYGAADLTVNRNVVKNGLRDAEGIRFRDSERFDCYDNTIENSGGSGISVVHIGDWEDVNGLVGGDGRIRQNKISESHLRGISVPYRQLKAVEIFGNTITDTSSNFEPLDSGDGILVGAPGSRIDGNVIEGATGNGISAMGAGVMVADNRITGVGTGRYGTRSGVSAHAPVKVVSNTIRRAARFGICATPDAQLDGNVISSAGLGEFRQHSSPD